MPCLEWHLLSYHPFSLLHKARCAPGQSFKWPAYLCRCLRIVTNYILTIAVGSTPPLGLPLEFCPRMCGILIINSHALLSLLNYCLILYHSIISQKPHIPSDDKVQPVIITILFHNFSQLCISQHFFTTTIESLAPLFSFVYTIDNFHCGVTDRIQSIVLVGYLHLFC